MALSPTTVRWEPSQESTGESRDAYLHFIRQRAGQQVNLAHSFMSGSKHAGLIGSAIVGGHPYPITSYRLYQFLVSSFGCAAIFSFRYLPPSPVRSLIYEMFYNVTCLFVSNCFLSLSPPICRSCAESLCTLSINLPLTVVCPCLTLSLNAFDVRDPR